jgi:hypothetical protein
MTESRFSGTTEKKKNIQLSQRELICAYLRDLRQTGFATHW